MLNRHSSTVRSAPAYVSMGDEVVSLVLEGEIVGNETAGDLTGGKLRPTAVYVIDSSGVSRLAVQPGRWRAATVILIALGICLQYALQRWRRRTTTGG
ncbi:MAG: hypothetical protein ABIO92_06560 [Chloroflexia bacterium]